MLTTPASQPRQAAQAARAAYPVSPSDDVPLRQFWLTAWLRARAELDAFFDLVGSSAVLAKRSRSDPLDHAVIGACIALEDHEHECLWHLLKAGGLLLAWQGTAAV